MSEMEVPDGWEIKRLDSVCIVERGKFGHRPRNDPDYYGGKYPFIQTGDIVKSNGKVNSYSQTLNEKGFKVSRLFPKGTVVITIAANIGDTAILEIDSCFPDSIIGMIPIEGKTTSKYIEYVLRTYKNKLNRDAKKGAQKNINYDFLKPLQIPIPPTIDVQKKIVQKLDNILTQLEEKKKEIFSLIEQNIKKIDFFEKNFFSEIMKKHLYIDNYPSTWTVKILGDITKRIGGGTPSKNKIKYYQGDICWLTISDLSNEITYPKIVNDSKMKITEQAIEESSAKKIPKGAVILGTRVGVGKLGIAGSELTTNQDFNSFICSKEIEPYFLGCYFLSIRQQLQNKSRGLTVKGITTSELDNLKIGYPPIKKQKEIIQNIKNAGENFELQKNQFENIKQNYESRIKYINHIQSSILDTAFSGKLVN